MNDSKFTVSYKKVVETEVDIEIEPRYLHEKNDFCYSSTDTLADLFLMSMILPDTIAEDPESFESKLEKIRQRIKDDLYSGNETRVRSAATRLQYAYAFADLVDRSMIDSLKTQNQSLSNSLEEMTTEAKKVGIWPVNKERQSLAPGMPPAKHHKIKPSNLT